MYKQNLVMQTDNLLKMMASMHISHQLYIHWDGRLLKKLGNIWWIKWKKKPNNQETSEVF